LIAAHKQKLELLKQHKKGLMQRMFPIMNYELRITNCESSITNKKNLPELRFPEFKNSGEWVVKRLGEVAKILKGKQLNRLDMIENGKFPVINGGIEPSGYTNTFNTKKNAITISEGGNSCGFVNYIKEDFWSGGHCYTLNDIKTNTKYLFFALKSQENKIMRLRVGSGLPNIQKGDLEKFVIGIPLKKIEQQKIASFLSNLDELIAAETEKIEQLERHKKGLMQRVFPITN